MRKGKRGKNWWSEGKGGEERRREEKRGVPGSFPLLPFCHFQKSVSGIRRVPAQLNRKLENFTVLNTKHLPLKIALFFLDFFHIYWKVSFSFYLDLTSYAEKNVNIN